MTETAGQSKHAMPILIVIDDEKAITDIVGQLFTGSLEVMTANTVDEALGLLSQLQLIKASIEHRLSLLTDFNMPDKSGLMLVRAIRAQKVFKDVPIVAMSGDFTKPIIAQLLAAGTDAILCKPFTRDLVLRKLDEATQNRLLMLKRVS